jgi:hypothetical protein
LWRGPTRAGRGGASGSRSCTVVVASPAGTVDRGARFIGDVTRARVVEGARDLAIHAIERPSNASLVLMCRCLTRGRHTPSTRGHLSLLRLQDSKCLVRGDHQAHAVIEAGGSCTAVVVCARAEQRLPLPGPRGGVLGASEDCGKHRCMVCRRLLHRLYQVLRCRARPADSADAWLVRSYCI